MRYIRTSNNYVEFIEADDNDNILSARGFQFGELYFRIENNKVTFYLNDQENPWRNDVWTINIPFLIDGTLVENEDDASAILHNIMNDRFQEQLDELRSDLDEEIGRSIATDEALGEEIDDERDRAISAETYLQNQVTQVSATVETFDGRITHCEEAVSAMQEDLHDEIVRSTNKDTEHDVMLSGLTDDIADLEEKKQNKLTAGKYISIVNDVISADSNHVYRLTQNAYDNLSEIDPEGLYIITDAPDISLCDYTPLSAFTAEVNRSTTKDLEHDLLISGMTDGLDVEIKNRIAADNLLQQNIDNEIARATSAETILHDEIINERDRALASESAITLALHNEVVRSTEKDALHDTLISGLTTNLQNEIERATEAENSLRDDLNAEITRSTNKDAEHDTKLSGFNTDLQAEITRATEAENNLRDDLNAEVSRATAKETELSTKISGLSDDIDDEIARATARENEVETKVDRLSGETYVISGALSTKITEIETKIVEVSGDTYSKNQIDTKLALKQNKLSAGTGINIDSNNVISASGEIDAYTKAESDAKYQPKLTAGSGITIDENNVISATGGSKAIVAGRGIKVTSGETADTVAFDMPITDSNPSSTWDGYLEMTKPLGIGSHLEMSTDKKFVVSQNNGDVWRANDFVVSGDGRIFINDYHSRGYRGIRDVYCLQDKLDSLQPILSAGTGVDITDNVISVTGGGESSGVTSGDVQTMINESISGKADSSDVYLKTETYNKTEVDNKVWCGDETAWSQISGSTENGVIYLVY